ncbi:MAG: M16 family metallopeptidase, partial [Armatimonadota bacterium]
AMFEDKWVEQVRTNILKHFSAESDNVFQDAYSKLRGLLYEDSGYRRPLLGFERIVRKATAQDLKRFYASYYVPNNMIISIAGDVTPEQALDAVEKAFAGIVPIKLPLDRGIPDETLVQPKYIAYESNTPAAYILLGWLAPPMRSPDYPAFVVAANALGGGKGSLMYKEIRQKRGMAYDLGIFYPWLKYQSHLVAYVITDPYKEVLPNIKGPLVIDEIKQLILKQIETLKQRKLSDAELQRAKGYTIGTFVRTQQHLVDRAYFPAWFEAIGIGYDAVQKLPDLFEKVTAEDVQHVVQKYLGNYAAVIVMPANRKPSTLPN